MGVFDELIVRFYSELNPKSDILGPRDTGCRKTRQPGKYHPKSSSKEAVNGSIYGPRGVRIRHYQLKSPQPGTVMGGGQKDPLGNRDPRFYPFPRPWTNMARKGGTGAVFSTPLPAWYAPTNRYISS